MVTVRVEDVSFCYDRKKVLDRINFTAEQGEITAVIGPNGAGKSTLLKTIAKIVQPDSGEIFFDEKRLSRMRKEDVSRIVSYLPQDNVIPGILTVFEVVMLGRIPYLNWRIGEEDLKITVKVMKELGIDNYAKRYANKLSGGERQVVLVAQALVREPEVLLLDEPVSNLDIRNKLEILELIRKITKEKKMTTILVLHDLNLAAMYADNVIILSGGRVYARGKPYEVLSEDVLSSVYGIEAEIRRNGEKIQVIPLRPVKCDGKRQF